MSTLQRLLERFWFFPAVLCLVALVLAEGLVAVDRSITGLGAPGWVELFVYQVGESGSRDVLSTIATASLAVAGTTFSITMAVLALTSSTYGPRLVRNFMADRGNQLVLGVYVATFLYSLVVLRSIRVLGDPGDQDAQVFVPHLAVNGAVLLGIANVGVLVYFIHHISDSIQIATLASGVRADLRATVDRLYPESVGHGETATEDTRVLEEAERDGVPVLAGRPGYVQSVHDDDLMGAATDHDVLLVLRVRPGEYVLDDTVLVLVHPPERVGDDLRRAVRDAFDVTDARTPFQDVDYAVQQLTEIAVRALSPGTNDPYTAVNALDDLSAGLSLLAARPTPSSARYDDHGVLRVHAEGTDVTVLVGAVLDSLRWYGASAPLVMHHCLEFVDRVGERNRHASLRTLLLTQVELLRNAFGAAGHGDHDVFDFDGHAERVRTRLLSRKVA